MILPDIRKLYEPYAKDASLETTIIWCKREAAKASIPDSVRDLAIAQTFVEMSAGKTFEIGTCNCGCNFPIPWSCVALNHYILRKMFALKVQYDKAEADAITKYIQDAIVKVIELENAAFTKQELGKNTEDEVTKKPWYRRLF